MEPTRNRFPLSDDMLQIVSSFHGIDEMIYLLVSNAFMRRQMFSSGCKML